MDCFKFKPGNRSKCGICGLMWSKHSQQTPKSDQRISASNARASNEIMLNEILNLVFPDGRKVFGDELTLRLHLVMGIFEKYGFGRTA